jgi:predicted TIM-barrel fold metal-dependent hydrolase
MAAHSSYIGFDPLPSTGALIESLFEEPVELRWRTVRQMLRIEDPAVLEDVRQQLHQKARRVWPSLHWKIKARVQMAKDAIQRPVRVADYAVVKGMGAFTLEELKAAGPDLETLQCNASDHTALPAVDCHIHPKTPDLKFLSDLRKAKIGRAVVLATDTDPADVDRPDIIAKLRENYTRSELARRIPFDRYQERIRADLYSSTHVTDWDVADWVADYPDVLIGFGSVNLSKGREYVRAKLARIETLGLRGIKLLPYSQFFNPAENECVAMLFDFCRRVGGVVLSHSGCAAGPFELVELSQDCRPELWEPMAQAYPDVPIVLAHFASYSSQHPGIWFDAALSLMRRHRNVHADISAVSYLLEDQRNVRRIRASTGFNQILFGSDYPGPLLFGQSLAGLVAQVNRNPHLSKGEKYAILGGNARQIL